MADGNEIRQYDMKALIDSNPNIITIIDPRSYTCLFQNKTGEKALGALKGKTCYQNIPKQPNVCPFCKMQDAIRTGDRHSSEVKLPDGNWLLVQFSPIKNEKGEVDIVETITDITEQKKQQEELQETVNLLMETIPGGEDEGPMDSLKKIAGSEGYITQT